MEYWQLFLDVHGFQTVRHQISIGTILAAQRLLNISNTGVR